MNDGSILSFATVAPGFWLLIFLAFGGFFIYLFVTKLDQEEQIQADQSSATRNENSPLSK